jgi:hypothetical protein
VREGMVADPETEARKRGGPNRRSFRERMWWAVVLFSMVALLALGTVPVARVLRLTTARPVPWLACLLGLAVVTTLLALALPVLTRKADVRGPAKALLSVGVLSGILVLLAVVEGSATSAAVQVANDSSRALAKVSLVVAKGQPVEIGSIQARESVIVTVCPDGESSARLRFDADGQTFEKEAVGYLECSSFYQSRVTVDDALQVTEQPP